ncbi:Kinetochore component CENP-S protein [Raphanus sativus]|uniref:Protein MHF1 homolog isoform X1 n=1 Tax=Raphanus sativus TaxID=3726 RepID=A0A9W3CQM7_RAPSA|nr:protein MHF1 homolog isoform X1 [Raphanus sativus]KAJ4870906.1 Kinetochore component CENP-S protein [Raphanus sativus]
MLFSFNPKILPTSLFPSCQTYKLEKVESWRRQTSGEYFLIGFSAISFAEAKAKKSGMEIAGPVVACVAYLAFNIQDLELFAHHAGRKIMNMDDVILSAHRNDNLASSLRSLDNELQAKEPQPERKRKKVSTKKDDKSSSSNAVCTNRSLNLQLHCIRSKSS